jgi:predicted nucleic acid-binding protein
MDLLLMLFGEVLVPPAVRDELAKPRGRFKPLLLENWPFLQIRNPADRAAVQSLMASLHLGEAEAIVLAGEVHAHLLLMDEADGRAVAEQRGLMPMGVLGVLLRAKRKHLVEELAPLLDTLEHELGFFISPDVRRNVLVQAGEGS